MATKLLAYVALITASFALTLVNYWYTFGLWPQSWTSFVGCWFGMTILVIVQDRVMKE